MHCGRCELPCYCTPFHPLVAWAHHWICTIVTFHPAVQAAEEFQQCGQVALYYEPRDIAVMVERHSSLRVDVGTRFDAAQFESLPEEQHLRYWVAVASPNGIDLHKFTVQERRVQVAQEVRRLPGLSACCPS